MHVTSSKSKHVLPVVRQMQHLAKPPTATILSISPTLQLIRWTKQAHSKKEPLPADEQIRHILMWFPAEMTVVVLMPLLAAATWGAA